jgi:hypothetical protein
MALIHEGITKFIILSVLLVPTLRVGTYAAGQAHYQAALERCGVRSHAERGNESREKP